MATNGKWADSVTILAVLCDFGLLAQAKKRISKRAHVRLRVCVWQHYLWDNNMWNFQTRQIYCERSEYVCVCACLWIVSTSMSTMKMQIYYPILRADICLISTRCRVFYRLCQRCDAKCVRAHFTGHTLAWKRLNTCGRQLFYERNFHFYFTRSHALSH